MWSFMETNKPAWDLVVTNPSIVTGPLIHPMAGPESVNAMTDVTVGNFVNGTYPKVEGILFPLYHQVSSGDHPLAS